MMSNVMVFYHFKGSMLTSKIPTVELKFDVELHIAQKFLSQTETDRSSTDTGMLKFSPTLVSANNFKSLL
jgi:hypothetical protein